MTRRPLTLRIGIALQLIGASILMFGSAAWADPAAHYREKCAQCHGADRLGDTGPALIPQTLRRMGGPKIANMILQGRPPTEMPAFADQISAEDANLLAVFLKTPLERIPPWGEDQIQASRTFNEDYVAVEAPVWPSDPKNITLVVETDVHYISVLDGDSFEVLTRFEAPFAVHGAPKLSPDGRYVYVMSRDGWVQKYDLWALREIGRVRAGLNSRNIAISHDGKWLAVANYLPGTLTILSSEDLSFAAIHQINGKDGTPSRVSAVYTTPPRESFILALKDVPEIWEVFYGAKPPFYGFVHDYRDEGPPRETKSFPMRRITTRGLLDDFYFDPTYEYVLGASGNGDGGAVIDLVIGQTVADLELPGRPRLGSAVTWKQDGRTLIATPHLKDNTVSVIDAKSWKTVKRIKTQGPGFFMRSHQNSPHLWGDVFFGPNKDVVHLIDKKSLEIAHTLRPVPGAAVGHIEFTHDGSHALVSVWEDDGAVIVYDAKTLEEVTRLPMRKPLGKYNIGNRLGQ